MPIQKLGLGQTTFFWSGSGWAGRWLWPIFGLFMQIFWPIFRLREQFMRFAGLGWVELPKIWPGSGHSKPEARGPNFGSGLSSTQRYQKSGVIFFLIILWDCYLDASAAWTCDCTEKKSLENKNVAWQKPMIGSYCFSTAACWCRADRRVPLWPAILYVSNDY